MGTLFVGMGGGLDVVNAAAMYHISRASYPNGRFYLASVREVDRNTFINANAQTHHGQGTAEFHRANVPMRGFKVKDLSKPGANYESRFAEPAVSRAMRVPVYVVSPSDAEETYTLAKNPDGTLQKVPYGTPNSFLGTKWKPFDEALFASRLRALCAELRVGHVVFVDGGGDALIRQPHHMNIQSAVGNTGDAQAFEKYKADSQDYRVISAIANHPINVDGSPIAFHMAVLSPGIDANVETIIQELNVRGKLITRCGKAIFTEILGTDAREVEFVGQPEQVRRGLENWRSLVKEVVALKPGDLRASPPKERSLTATTSYYAYGGEDPEGKTVGDGKPFWTGSEWKALSSSDREDLLREIQHRNESIYGMDLGDPKKWSRMHPENRKIYVVDIVAYHKIYASPPDAGCIMLQRLSDEQQEEWAYQRETQRRRFEGASAAHYQGHLFL